MFFLYMAGAPATRVVFASVQDRREVDTGVVLMVLLAAFLHAGWNAIAKGIPSRLASSTLIALVYLVFGAVALFFFPAPALGSWVFIAVSSCVHTGYIIVLTTSYKYGDFSQVYPLARGLAVILVALASTFFLGQHLDLTQLMGVAVIAAALLSLAFIEPRSSSAPSRRGVMLAALTGMTIAAYTLIDGEGVRNSGSPFGYVAWVFVLQGVMIPLTCLLISNSRRSLGTEIVSHWKLGSLGGLLSLIAYTIVVWAQSIAPFALVAALRETSVLLAGLLGWLLFGERFSKLRMALVVAAVAGVVVLQTK